LFLNVAAYRFVALDDLVTLRARLTASALERELKGTILLAAEGINLGLAGTDAAVEDFLAGLCADPRFAGLEVKRSRSATQPFGRLRVRLKREIVALKRPDIRPDRTPAPRVSPRTLRTWLDEGRDLVLLDTRNAFEVARGTFDGAHDPGLASFSELPSRVDALPADWRERTVVTFCTGGIRCEKAAPLLAAAGFRDVVQLDGGILRWFEECGDAYWRGDCFVFDERVALDPRLAPVRAAGQVAAGAATEATAA
jgi:UPF0176 protein